MAIESGAYTMGMIETVKTGIELAKNPYAHLLDLRDQKGDFIRFNIGNKNAFLVSSSDDVQQLLSSHSQDLSRDTRDMRIFREIYGDNLFGIIGGEQWRSHRAMSQPAFHRHMVDQYLDIVTSQTQKMFGQWDKEQDISTKSFTRTDLHQDLNNLAAGIISEALFGYKIENNQQKKLGLAISDVFRFYSLAVREAGIPWVARAIPIFGYQKAKEGIQYLQQFAMDIINQGDPDTNNLLGFLIREHKLDSKKFTQKELIDEIVGFFVAGHETTANASIWTFYKLSQRQDLVEILRTEVNTKLTTANPTPDILRNLQFPKMCFKEAMRLYPPVWIFNRRAKNQIVLSDNKIIPKGSTIVISPYILHHDSRNWQNHNEFKPDRFKSNTAMKSGTYIPFGIGERSCIGAPLAMIEGSTFVALAFQRYDISIDPDLRPATLAVMRPDRPVKATFTIR